MKPIIHGLVLVCVLTGCVYVPQQPPPAESSAKATPQSTATDSPPEHDITALLGYRERVCATPATERRQWLAGHRLADDRRTKLQVLVTASCEPRRYAALLGGVATTLQDDYASDPGYRTLFAMIVSFSGALNAEQIHLEKTIRGLTDIEEDIGGNDDDSTGDRGTPK